MSPRRTHYSSSVLLTLKHSPQFNSSKDWIGKLFLEKAIHLKCQKPQCVETPLKTTTLFNFKLKNKRKNLNLSDDTTPDNWRWFRRHALLHPSPFTRLQIQQRNFLIHFTLENGWNHLTGTRIRTHASYTSVCGNSLVNHHTANWERHS